MKQGRILLLLCALLGKFKNFFGHGKSKQRGGDWSKGSGQKTQMPIKKEGCWKKRKKRKRNKASRKSRLLNHKIRKGKKK